MIPGSKLVCINPNHETLEFLKSIGNKIPNGTPQIYTLRNLEKVEGIWSLRLVEITNPEMFYQYTGLVECYFLLRLFREIEPLYINEDKVISGDEKEILMEIIDFAMDAEIDDELNDDL
jgi:hypothetical protein